MKILTYLRPNGKAFFESLANGIFPGSEVVTHSDQNHLADVWSGKYIYSERYDFNTPAFEEEEPDILPRCRILRKMERNLAHTLAQRYWNGMEELFSENRFDYLIASPVDCYSLDILCRVAEKHDTKIISINGAPFTGYAKLTIRGEYNKVRDFVPEDETRRLLEQMIQTTYLTPSETHNVRRNYASIYLYHLRRLLIENVYNRMLKIWNHDPWNSRYNTYEVKGVPLRAKFDRNFEKRFVHTDELRIDPKTTVYYPMHLVPEATVDYWCQDLKFTNYAQFVLGMIQSADSGITFIIKEHPAMYGKRLLSFYDQLNALPNVILLHPMDRSNRLLLEVENVVVDNGTVGIEALIRGKRVICLSDNYYRRFHPNAFLSERVTKESLEFPLCDFDNRAFIECLLQGCFPSNFQNSRHGIAVSNVQQAVDGIISYLDTNGLPR